MNYYSVLDIVPTASMEDIKNVYNEKLNNCLNEDDRNLLNKAYETLIDYNSRRKYDNSLKDISEDVKGYTKSECESFEMEEDNFNSNSNNLDNLDSFDNLLLCNDDLDVKDLLKKINDQFSNILFRLENIEKRIYSNNFNDSTGKYYKERKKIDTRYNKGKKVVTIATDINNNGKKSNKQKTIEYDENGNQKVTIVTPKFSIP